MSGPADGGTGEGRLLDFERLAGRIGVSALVLGSLAFAAVVLEGLASGLTFALILRWAAVFLVSLVAATAVLVATSALQGADRAQRRGERLSGEDVGLRPPRRRRDRDRDHDRDA